MRNVTFLIALFITSLFFVDAQEAIVRVENMTMKTYMFSDPNSVAEPGRIYPYFRFDGYTSNDIQKEWKMVILENDYIKVFVCPDIGGKVWGAIEKSTGNEFLYYNNVVKFRDVAMRGPWTSGGLEYNFGDIGHIPSCATPVDYIVKENTDGSVSCIVGAIDLPSRTRWNVEINLQKDKAYFQTKASWFNLTSVPNTYYHWMNAAAKASGNLHFIYPGDHYIGHGGEKGSWPIENDRDLSRYENNNFGSYKSYHVINSYSNFFGGYWRDDDFGFGHLSSYDDKPGKKLWIWGLSRQGMIWEDLLTDNDGQYIEFQAGKLFNQAAYSSTFTPFKHKEFLAYDSDIMIESWFPLVKTGGMVAASEYAVMNVTTENNIVEVKISALQNLNDNLVIKSGNEIITRKRIYLNPLQLDSLTFDNTGVNDFTIELGDSKLIYKSSMKHVKVDRPIDLNMDFDFNSAYGLYIRGLELEKQRMYNEALDSYELCLEKEKTFAPAINKKALLLYKKMDYNTAQKLALSSLAIDTYDPEANYIYGLACIKIGEASNAKSGFSIAAASVKYRTASYTELAGIFLRENNFPEALKYADKALSYNQYNISAYNIQAISYRKTNQKVKAFEVLDKLTQLDPTSQFAIFEKYLWNETSKNDFLASVYNELPTETFLELSIFYYNLECDIDALNVLKLAPKTPIVSLWLAKLDKENQVSHLNSTLIGSINLIFPFREESAALLEEFIQKNNNWKLKYYLGLIYWNKGMLISAQKLFKDCNNTPDDDLFYLAKAKLFSDFPEIVFESLKKARNLNKDDWRTALAMINYYMTNSQAKDALPLAQDFALRYPERPALGLSYVEALIKTKQYKKSIQFIEKYNLLPFEGGTIGRDLYHDACIQEALSNLKKLKFNNAIKYAEKALEWPENLGVGKPYEVDERLENYIIARAMEESGKKEKADYYFQNIASYKRPVNTKENSKLIFQLQAMRKLNEEQEAVNLLKNSMDEFPDNKYLKWVNSVFLQDKNQESIKNEILDNKAETKPYDIHFIDNEFELVTAISSTLDKY